MSATFDLYVVDEKKLPTRMAGVTDQQKYEQLVAAVRREGGQWGHLELRVRDFASALELLDAHLGGTRFLPVFAFNNSPANVLGNFGNCPSFGYFNPAQTRDLHASLAGIPQQVLDNLALMNDDVFDQTLYAFQSSAEEAARRGYALAVIHS